MTEAGEIALFRDRCSELMGALLDELAQTPGVPRTFPEVEAALGWPRRRIASVLGGVSHMRHTEFGGCRPYRFLDERESASGRWEIWMDAVQAAALNDEDPAAHRALVLCIPLTERVSRTKPRDERSGDRPRPPLGR